MGFIIRRIVGASLVGGGRVKGIWDKCGAGALGFCLNYDLFDLIDLYDGAMPGVAMRDTTGLKPVIFLREPPLTSRIRSA
jgi:hypothetical protein